MADHEMLTCPLCQGYAKVSRSDLIGLLSDRALREKIEKYLAELTGTQPELAGVGVKGSRDFEKDVHSWNPQLPMWNRSPKE
ncbi:MAG: hypothetical protein LAO03_20225 [Acidobacteriia bacterium]|nr:hypothetical protein [Terriglobia bacterium]